MKCSAAQSYLPIFQYDATLFGPNNNREMKGDILTFNLISNLAFRIVGVFFVKTKRRTSFIVPTSNPILHPNYCENNISCPSVDQNQTIKVQSEQFHLGLQILHTI